MTSTTATFAVGSLVRARGREWVVLPESEEDLLILRPLGGSDEEVAGIHLGLEKVEGASLKPPSADDLGDYRSGRLLRDAVRLGFRSSAGPFRSFGRIACEPRPYQLVPLLMALRLDPVRLLVADDVGIGKTIEACLIARELLDRGEVQRLAVLCPPHLAEQWQRELRDKFNLEAELVLSSTARRLEQNIPMNQSLFEVYPYTIVSTDFIKSDRRRADFLRACPELVIVDEAHTCASLADGHSARHQRHQLLRGLTEDPDRHLILVTATPHSGKEEAFRSLLALLDRGFANLPDDLTGAENEPHRRRLAAHLIQRRRPDIEHYLNADTPFPKREEKEETYKLDLEYKRLFDRALRYAREIVRDRSGGFFRQRVRWWSALALLRSLASSPAAAAATLRNRAANQEAESIEQADEIGRRTVLDPIDDEAAEGMDVAPIGDAEAEGEDPRGRRQLLEMAGLAERLMGEKDAKVQKAITLVKALINDGYQPIVFCRYIPTAEYVANELRNALPRTVEVAAVTGQLPPADREARVEALADKEKRVLVCTDCLSEGINLQDMFDAVVHYDLSWNPTRHEQREGRVDRYGQSNKTVRVITYYGTDNQIDGVVLDVLLRKHKTIRSSTGVSIPVPGDTEAVMQALMQGALLKGEPDQLVLDVLQEPKNALHAEWQSAADREKRSRTMFAQHAIKTDEVANELEAARRAIGSSVDAESFLKAILTGYGARFANAGRAFIVNLEEVPAAVRDAITGNRDVDEFTAQFSLPVTEGVLYLQRTHPIVEGLAGYVLDSALDPLLASRGLARRAGVMRTADVEKRTVALLLRLRYHIVTKSGTNERALLAEDWQLVAYRGSPKSPEWVTGAGTEGLLLAEPTNNIPADIAQRHLEGALAGLANQQTYLADVARKRGDELLEAHKRVRRATRATGISQRIEPKLPVDVLGIYLYLPAAAQ